MKKIKIEYMIIPGVFSSFEDDLAIPANAFGACIDDGDKVRKYYVGEKMLIDDYYYGNVYDYKTLRGWKENGCEYIVVSNMGKIGKSAPYYVPLGKNDCVFKSNQEMARAIMKFVDNEENEKLMHKLTR